MGKRCVSAYVVHMYPCTHTRTHTHTHIRLHSVCPTYLRVPLVDVVLTRDLVEDVERVAREHAGGERLLQFSHIY